MLLANDKPTSASAENRTDQMAKLHDMACKLRLGMSKENVERELGKPKYSPTTGVFYYTWEPTGYQGVPLGIVVEYRRQSIRDSGNQEYTGSLESYTVGPIAE
jgi:hypothetical protein